MQWNGTKTYNFYEGNNEKNRIQRYNESRLIGYKA